VRRLRRPPTGEVVAYSWPDHGFCHAGCAADDRTGGFSLLGPAAEELAERAGRRGGPGFERAIVIAWLAGARTNAPAMLTRSPAEADLVGGLPNSWCWRLWTGGECRAMRVTPKEGR
jgi:hypothetical protein